MLPAEYYLPLKFVHIVSSVLMVGTGFGSAFYMFFANRSGSLSAQAVVSRLVVRADWWFTTPTVIFQPVSGILLVLMAGWPLTTPWVLLSLVLYAIAGVCWLPVVWLQVRMAKMAQDAVACGLWRARSTCALPNLCAALGASRLPSLFGYGGGVLADGDQT